MIVSQTGIFENQEAWHRQSVAQYLDTARDRLARPDPDYPALISELRLAIEFAQLLVVPVEPAPPRGQRTRSKS